ncbi:hypothetical protein [Chamaesiphon sp. OTE_20_metabat_361]|uniref:hypothetical protein n=1 Tax=Chamaesiphon sp. OTE_20_metabat_361 TaxID=2964689 RepID=UPI00286B9889|nr:hypothetical protein [Chamaesiphon sp. OTE_20_metabat_361]
MQQAIFWTVEEVATRAKKLYADNIRSQVEHEENIGKMVVIDAQTGEYAVDRSGIHSAIALKAKNPNARLFTIRIGYDVAVSFGGNSDRVSNDAG